MTGRVVECPIDEMNRPRGAKDAGCGSRRPSRRSGQLFAGWGGELATCRKFAPTARNYTASKLMAEVGLRVNEARKLDLADIKWDLGRFGKLHVRHGKGARGSGPRERMVPLINGADRTLRWFIEDVWGQFDDDHTRPGAPLFPSERKNADGSSRPGRRRRPARRPGEAAATRTCRAGASKLTPHVLRHFCASQLYLGGLDLIAIQEVLGHSWIATTMRYVHVQQHPGRGRLGRRASSGPPSGWKDWSDEVEPAAGRREPGHLEGHRAPADARRTRPGDLGREDVRAVVRPARSRSSWTTWTSSASCSAARSATC